MINAAIPENTFYFIKKNWFQIGIGILFLYVLIQKDLSFSINFQSPAEQEQINNPKRKQVLTDISKEKSQNNEMLTFDFSNTGYSYENSLSKIEESVKIDFLKRFVHVAVSEQNKFNIPASVILASGMLQSKAGTAEFYKVGNNLFAIQCLDDWSGERMLLANRCFRKYETAWLSFRDHSKFLTSGKFNTLNKIGRGNYKIWAKGLEELHFSKKSGFANQLIQVIEKYKLYELDK